MNKKTGLTLVLGSAFFYASYGIWSRLMASTFGDFSQAWTRYLILLIVVLIINWKWKIFKPIVKQDIPWLLAIAFAGGLNQAPYYFGFKHLDIGTAIMLFYTGLVTGGYIWGKFVFKEKITFKIFISLILGILGMLVIYKFDLKPNQIFPALMTILAGFMGSAGVILPKKTVGDYQEFQVMTWYLVVGFIVNGIISIFLKDSIPNITNIKPWLAQIGYSTAFLLANWVAIKGYKYFDASVASLLGLTEIIFGIIFGMILFGELLTTGMFYGALLIMVSAMLPHIKFKFSNTTKGKIVF